MGLHQRITDRTTSEPCDCGADDDHDGFVPEGHVYSDARSEDQLLDYDEAQPLDEEHFLPGVEPLDEEEDVPEGKGFTTT